MNREIPDDLFRGISFLSGLYVACYVISRGLAKGWRDA